MKLNSLTREPVNNVAMEQFDNLTILSIYFPLAT